MIAMLDKSLLISMPTKCGTERLKSTLVRKLGVAEELPHDHGWTRYAGYQKRVLLVRDPLARWVSTYYWLKSTEKNQGFKKVLNGCLKTFVSFTSFVASTDSAAYVFQSLAAYVSEFNPDAFLPLERTIPDWGNIFDVSWLPVYLATAPHKTKGKRPLNVSLKRLPAAFVDLLSSEYGSVGIYGSARTKKAPPEMGEAVGR